MTIASWFFFKGEQGATKRNEITGNRINNYINMLPYPRLESPAQLVTKACRKHDSFYVINEFSMKNIS